MSHENNGRDDPTDSSDSSGTAFIAEFTLSSPEIRVLAELVPGVELRMVDHYVDRSGVDHGIFWVTAEDYDGFEEAISESRIIDAWERLIEIPTRRLYDIVVSETGELVGAIETSREYNIVWQTMNAHQGRLFVRAMIPGRSAIRTFRREIRDRGYDFSLERVITDIEPALSDGLSISVRQREALVLAYERGYYRQPREVTLEEIGEELGISESAVSGRLNRGLATLIAECLDVTASRA